MTGNSPYNGPSHDNKIAVPQDIYEKFINAANTIIDHVTQASDIAAVDHNILETLHKDVHGNGKPGLITRIMELEKDIKVLNIIVESIEENKEIINSSKETLVDVNARLVQVEKQLKNARRVLVAVVTAAAAAIVDIFIRQSGIM